MNDTRITMFLVLHWLPLVSGLIQEVAQWIFKGHPLNTLEKHAPIYKREEDQKVNCNSLSILMLKSLVPPQSDPSN